MVQLISSLVDIRTSCYAARLAAFSCTQKHCKALIFRGAHNLFRPDLVDKGETKGIFSSGGIVFNTSHFGEPMGYNYQLFSDSTKGGELAGCGSGTCLKTVFTVPGPLPLLGVGAAFGYSRTLRKRIKRGQATGTMD